MRIKLIKLYSEPEIFKAIEFTDGVNLIMGEKVEENGVKKGKKTNGVGKSLCVEFINFCLLKKQDKSRVMKIPLDKFMDDTQIILDMSINDNPIKIIRTKEKPDNPIIIKDGYKTEFSNLDDANEYLRELLFSDSSDDVNLSFREFLGPFTREESSEFKDILSCYDLTQRIPPAVKPNAYIFNLDIKIIDNIQKCFKEIEKTNNFKKRLKKLLTENGTKKISDVKASLNSLNDDLKKIDLALDSFKSNDAYESMQEEITKTQVEIDGLRSRQSAIKYQMKRIGSFPSLEVIKTNEVEIVYNQFKSGLGDIITKSIEEVLDFKQKIDHFQKKLFSEKIKTLEDELSNVTNKIRILEEKQSEKIKIIDQKGILKDVKNGYAIYHQKKDQCLTTQSRYDGYEKAEQEWKQWRLERDTNFNKLDVLLFEAKSRIESFNNTILSIHEYIMESNEASFDIKTINKDKNKQILSFEMRIDDDGSHSVDRTKVFIYDLALLFNENTRIRHPKFLIHDNIFDVDQDTLIKSLNFLSNKESSEFQYILTLNRDKVENEEKTKQLELNIIDHTVANFTKKDRFLFGDKYSEM